MSAEANKEIVRRWYEELFNQRQVDANDRFLHPNYVNHGNNVHGLAAAKEAFTKQLAEEPPTGTYRLKI
jgi:predicted SnoaL-like aldol condensation-catalyzing enzyme